jgi:signal transduction histidine kinase
MTIERVRLIMPPSDEESNPKKEAVTDINGVIQDMLRVMIDARAIPSHIATQCKLDSRMPPIVTKENALKQVLLNLLRNAIEAMSSEGEIVIITRDNVFLGQKRYIEIVVADTGTGISEEVLRHLFEPVPSTKGPGHAGLGLVIVKRLIDELEGEMSCRPGEQGGTKFYIFLPRRTTL